MNLNILIVVIISTLSFSVFAVPVDWNGTLAIDSNIIKDVRRTGDSCTVSDGSQCINDEENNARFQSMIIKLNPSFVINDGVTIKAELTAGSDNRGARLGEDTDQNTGNNAYYAQSTSSDVKMNQIYAEIYADTALYRVGRFAKNFGLGAVVNDGNRVWDRMFSGYEGFEAQMKLGNFHLTPMWAKLSTNGNPNGKYDAYETSVSAVYDNANRNMKFGVYYSIKEVESDNSLYGGTASSQNVTLIDIYFAKTWNKFSFELEIPMISGDVGNVYGTGDASIDSNAYILESKYDLNTKWAVGLNAGMIRGDDGESNGFEGMYLHPNYKISEIMFKYNYHSFMSASGDLYSSSMVNTTYAQLYAHYSTDAWTWKMSALWAKANAVAASGDTAYNHEKGKEFTATEDQSDDMGYEFDIAFDYQWNSNVLFTGYLAHHMVGDYFGFSNESDELSLTNVTATGMRLSVNF